MPVYWAPPTFLLRLSRSSRGIASSPCARNRYLLRTPIVSRAVRVAVESSSVTSVGFDASLSAMEIEFAGGAARRTTGPTSSGSSSSPPDSRGARHAGTDKHSREESSHERHATAASGWRRKALKKAVGQAPLRCAHSEQASLFARECEGEEVGPGTPFLAMTTLLLRVTTGLLHAGKSCRAPASAERTSRRAKSPHAMRTRETRSASTFLPGCRSLNPLSFVMGSAPRALVRFRSACSPRSSSPASPTSARP